MLRMLIVDDEPVIADGLVEMLEEQEAYAFELCCAYSGKEAVNEMMKGKVDILLTDICMPDMSGLDLQTEFLRQWPYGKVIFLTGHNDFEYIQQAIRNGSIDYVLKLEGDDAILKAVEVAVTKINEDIIAMEKSTKAEEARLSYASFQRGRLLRDIMSVPLSERQPFADKLAALASPLFAELPVLLLQTGFVHSVDESGSFHRVQRVMEMQDAGKNWLSAACEAVPLLVGDDTVLWLTQPSCATGNPTVMEWDRMIRFLKGSMSQLQQLGEMICGGSLVVAVMNEPVNWLEIGICSEKLTAALRNAGPLRNEALIVVGRSAGEMSQALPVPMVSEEMAIHRRFVGRIPLLQSMLESGLYDDLSVELDPVGRYMDECVLLAKEVVKELALSLSLMFIAHVNKMEFRDAGELKNLIDRIGSAMNGERTMSHAILFRHIVTGISEHSRGIELHDAARMIQYVRSHVDEHLDGDVSLTKMADLLHFNPSYFSRLFKSITDMGYAEYVSRTRLKKACELLEDSQLAVSRIGEMIGYQDPSNFTRFFRRQTGMSPQEYRGRETTR